MPDVAYSRRGELLSSLDSWLTDEELEELVDALRPSAAAPPKKPPKHIAEIKDETDRKEAFTEWENARIAHEQEVAAGRVEALREAFTLDEIGWKRAFAEGALYSKRPVDQREVDYKRGWFDGARHYLVLLPEAARFRQLTRAANDAEEAKTRE